MGKHRNQINPSGGNDAVAGGDGVTNQVIAGSDGGWRKNLKGSGGESSEIPGVNNVQVLSNNSY